jgi:hypothetical protein
MGSNMLLKQLKEFTCYYGRYSSENVLHQKTI